METTPMCVEKTYLLQILPKLTEEQARRMIQTLWRNPGEDKQTEMAGWQETVTSQRFHLPPSAEKKKRMLKLHCSDEASKKWLHYVEELETLEMRQRKIRESDRQLYRRLKRQCEEEFLPEGFIVEVLPKLLAYMKGQEEDETFIMILSGSPGCGKTTAAKVVARILGRPHYLISAPQVDHGHGLTGEGSSFSSPDCGEIVRGMLHTRCLNPIYIIDEVDKAPVSRTHPAVTDELLPICDGSADNFTDNLLGFPMDIRRSGIIMTANYPEQIPEPLKDRAILYSFADVEEDRMIRMMERYLDNRLAKRYSGLLTVDKALLREQIQNFYEMEIHSIRQHQKLIDGALELGYQEYLCSDTERCVPVSREMFAYQMKKMTAGKARPVGFRSR